MERKKFLIILAAGSGTRMGGDRPKQFMLLGGRAVLQMTIEKFLLAEPDIRVITVLPKGWVGWWRDYCLSGNFTCPQTFVTGGITRFHSVAAALRKVPDGAIVAVHDGVRPFISVEGIRRLFALAEVHAGVVPVLPCIDTMRPLRVRREGTDGTGGAETLELIPDMVADRKLLFASQTPQIFHSETLREAYTQPFNTSFTDDASVLENKKTPLTYVEGERLNIKITTQDDLVLAEALMSVQVSDGS
ncbi:MAG: 2-C-methyl-D-erythritol 4-phosphate cytidylyltransferase [Bacteroidales bacterium]|nr:2-C-methyl-D-erythritol 4-phosphate cytidylyltransferase [Bacteroidales bacterium]